MQHNYKISGLSCLGCSTKVESALNEVKGVNKAIVDMATGIVTIRASRTMCVLFGNFKPVE